MEKKEMDDQPKHDCESCPLGEIVERRDVREHEHRGNQLGVAVKMRPRLEETHQRIGRGHYRLRNFMSKPLVSVIPIDVIATVR